MAKDNSGGGGGGAKQTPGLTFSANVDHNNMTDVSLSNTAGIALVFALGAFVLKWGMPYVRKAFGIADTGGGAVVSATDVNAAKGLIIKACNGQDNLSLDLSGARYLAKSLPTALAKFNGDDEVAKTSEILKNLPEMFQQELAKVKEASK